MIILGYLTKCHHCWNVQYKETWFDNKMYPRLTDVWAAGWFIILFAQIYSNQEQKS